MADLKQAWGADGQAFTLTLTIATNTARQSTAVTFSSLSAATDVLVQVSATTNASGTSNTGYLNIYAYATSDAANSKYPDAITGSDGAHTLVSPTNLTLIRRLNTVANNTVYITNPISFALAFGGVLPEAGGIVVENQSGATLAAGAAWYQAVYGVSA